MGNAEEQRATSHMPRAFDWGIIGHEPIVHFLGKSLAEGRLAHAYLFAGPPHVGKKTVLWRFTQSLLCASFHERSGTGALKLPCKTCAACRQTDARTHPDLLLLERQEEKKNITIEAVREFVRRMMQSGLLSRRKVGIILGADTLSGEAQGALLKFLEEPPRETMVLLETAHAARLSAPVRSRLLLLRFSLVGDRDIREGLRARKRLLRQQEDELIVRAGGRPGVAFSYLEHPETLRQVQQDERAFTMIQNTSLAKRFLALEDLVAPKASFLEAQEQVRDVVKNWRRWSRSHLHQLVGREHLDALKWASWLQFFSSLEEGEQLLRDNVNPRLVLSHLLLTLPTP